MVKFLCWFLSSLTTVSSFRLSRSSVSSPTFGRDLKNHDAFFKSTPLLKMSSEEGDNNIKFSPSLSSRRKMIIRSGNIGFMSLSTFITILPSPATSFSSEPTTANGLGSVIIIGAGGRTGMEVSKAVASVAAASSSSDTTATLMTRTGKNPFENIGISPEIKSHMIPYPEGVDVRDFDSVQTAIRTSFRDQEDKTSNKSIVFVASASKQGGTATEVDDVGVGNVAKVAQDTGARLILVSALAVDRPQSKSFKMTNSLGGNLDGIMDAKRNGEEKVRDVMKKGGNYVIIRPGPFMNGKTKGKGAEVLEVNQGDMVGGGLSRDELAKVIVGSLENTSVKGVTVEVYRRETATKLEPDFVVPSGGELESSDSYEGLLVGAKKDS